MIYSFTIDSAYAYAYFLLQVKNKEIKKENHFLEG